MRRGEEELRPSLAPTHACVSMSPSCECTPSAERCVRGSRSKLGQDTHDLRLLAAHHLEAGEVAVGGGSRAVEHVDGMLRSVGPEGDGEVRLLAARFTRTCSITERMARSATPFSWWTCWGHVVLWMPSCQ